MSNILAGTYIDMVLLYAYLQFEIVICLITIVSMVLLLNLCRYAENYNIYLCICRHRRLIYATPFPPVHDVANKHKI